MRLKGSAEAVHSDVLRCELLVDEVFVGLAQGEHRLDQVTSRRSAVSSSTSSGSSRGFVIAGPSRGSNSVAGGATRVIARREAIKAITLRAVSAPTFSCAVAALPLALSVFAVC